MAKGKLPFKAKKPSHGFKVARTTGTQTGKIMRATEELKFHDVDFDDAVIAAGGVINSSIVLIPAGTDENERIGRKCTITNIGWRYRLTLPSTGTESAMTDQVRIIIYQDTQANGLTAAIDGASGLLTSTSFLAFKNLNNTGRYRVLLDRTHVLTASAGDSVASGEESEVHTFFKSVNIPLEFSAGVGALTELRSNNIGVMLMCSGGFLGLVSKFRLRFRG